MKLPDGTRFMPAHDERAELAPRDIVARAIDFEMKKRGIDCVYLDISHSRAAFLHEHFPTIYARCLEFGIDITKQPIPVVPAAHYTCGGIVTDLAGRTDLAGLYAVGEAPAPACTARTASPPTRCSKASCSAAPRPQAIEAEGFGAAVARAAAGVGREPRVRRRTRKSSSRTTGTSCAG